MVHAVVVAKPAAAAMRCEQLVGDLLLFRRQHRIKRLDRRDALLQIFQRNGVELLFAFETLDRIRPLPFSTLAVALCAPFLNALILFAQRVRERLPLRLLRGRDLERGLEVGKLRLDALARCGKRALLMMIALRMMPRDVLGRCILHLGDRQRHGDGGEAEEKQSGCNKSGHGHLHQQFSRGPSPGSARELIFLCTMLLMCCMSCCNGLYRIFCNRLQAGRQAIVRAGSRNGKGLLNYNRALS